MEAVHRMLACAHKAVRSECELRCVIALQRDRGPIALFREHSSPAGAGVGLKVGPESDGWE